MAKKAVDTTLLSYFRSKLLSDIPTKVSELENDAGYLTEHQDLSAYAKKTDIKVTVTDGSVTFDNGLTITRDTSTGVINLDWE